MEQRQSETDGPAIQVQALNLPTGGGAIEGIGEKFQADAFTGTASMSLPIPTSPCRDITPSLSIGYSSGSGNSPFGMGWGLSVLSITRKTNKGIPQYQGKDTFILSGAEDLVPLEHESRTTGDFHVQHYAPRNEGAFSLIEYWEDQKDPTNSHWVVITSDHTISIFGRNQQAQIANPNNKAQIFSWLLEETYTPTGDHQLYTYKQEDDENVPENLLKNRTISANRYLSKVQYGNDQPLQGSIVLGETELPAEEVLWHFEVVFDYGEYKVEESEANIYEPVGKWSCRKDPYSRYTSGFEVRTFRLCQHVLLFHHFKELGKHPVLVSAQRLNYDEGTGEDSIFSMLTSYQHFGADYSEKAEVPYAFLYTPAVEFGYSQFNETAQQTKELTVEGQQLSGLNGEDFHWVDLHGEGLPGVLEFNEEGAWYAAPSLSGLPDDTQSIALSKESKDYSLSQWERQASFPAVQYIDEQHGTTLNDVTGTGMLDVMVDTPTLSGYWEMGLLQQWDHYRPFEQRPSELHAQMQELVDMTGNNLLDIVQIGAERIRIYPSRGKDGYQPAIFAAPINDFPVAVQTSEQESVRFGNLSGGGLQDLIRITSNSISYWPNLGYGHFAAPIELMNTPDFGEDFKMNRLFLSDINGSGLQDLLYFHPDRIEVWLNESGNGFSESFDVELPTQFTEMSRINFADVTGQGSQSMVITTPADDQNEGLAPKHYYTDFCSTGKPYLLTTTKNNMGAETEITYRSSVDYYLKDKANGLPWITTLPFPVQVVASVTVWDHISNAKHSSFYAYHHGYYDGVEREFRGFGRVDEQTTEVFPDVPPTDASYSAPALSKTWFHPGVTQEEWPLLLEQYQQEFYQGDEKAWTLPGTEFDFGQFDMNDKTLHESRVALVGRPLRAEVTGLATGQTDCPYTVTQSNYKVTLRQLATDDDFGIFLTTDREALSYNYELRPEDPLISQSFTLETDEFGNTLLGADVIYPRRAAKGVMDEQLAWHIGASTSHYIPAQLDRADYLHSLPWHSSSYKLESWLAPDPKALLDFEELRKAVMERLGWPNVSLTSDEELIGSTRQIYAEVDGNTTKALPESTATLPVLLFQQYELAFSSSQLENAFSELDEATGWEALIEKSKYEEEVLTTGQSHYWNPGMTAHFKGEQDFYLPWYAKDPNGAKTTYTYDPYRLMVIETSDALNQKVIASDLDYQHLTAKKLTDINDNTSQVKIDALGHVIYTSFRGTEIHPKQPKVIVEQRFIDLDELETKIPSELKDIVEKPADFLGQAQSYFYYDLFAYQDREEPVFNVNLGAQTFANGKTPDNDKVLLSIARSDGFGRALEGKARVEGETSKDDFRWLTSGRIEYNNKGLPVRQWEPYFSDTYEFIEDAEAVKEGPSAILYYDAIDRNWQTVTPKGFLTRMKWNAWEESNYDANDLLMDSPYWEENGIGPVKNRWGGVDFTSYVDETLTEEDKARLRDIAELCENTPETSIHDGLGNTIIARQWLKKSVKEDAIPLDTTFEYDLQGRQITSTDPRLGALGNGPNFRMHYAFGEVVLKTEGVDNGTQYSMMNVYGNPLFASDSRGTFVTSSYDVLQRPVGVQVQNKSLQLDHLTMRQTYGDSIDLTEDERQVRNLLGQVVQLEDQAGQHTMPYFGVLGAPLQSITALLQDYEQEVDWNQTPSLLEEVDQFTEYDALGRVIQSTEPNEMVVSPAYQLSGHVHALKVQKSSEEVAVEFVKDIRYDAKGQRTYIKYHNDTETSYTYDIWTYAVTKIQTRKASKAGANDFLQNDHYTYDPVGNVLQKDDGTQAVQFHRQAKVTPSNQYTYDTLYRLIEAEGRQRVQEAAHCGNNIPQKHHAHDLRAVETYLETFTYDHGGNLLTLRRNANGNSAGSYSNQLVVSNTSNRAVSSDLQTGLESEDVDRYFDEAGNQLETGTALELQWNYRNNIAAVDFGSDKKAYYLYNSGGQRQRKVVEERSKNGKRITETRYYGSVEEHLDYFVPNEGDEQVDERYTTFRLSDGEQPFLTWHQWTVGKAPQGETELLWYQLSDMQDTVNLLLDGEGTILSREEFSPYGSTVYVDGNQNTQTLKTHRYCNKERDEGTGFYYYGMRYYQAHLGRWLSADPAGTIDGLNLYAFVGGNPATFNDSNGLAKRKCEACDRDFNSDGEYNAHLRKFSARGQKDRKKHIALKELFDQKKRIKKARLKTLKKQANAVKKAKPTQDETDKANNMSLTRGMTFKDHPTGRVVAKPGVFEQKAKGMAEARVSKTFKPPRWDPKFAKFPTGTYGKEFSDARDPKINKLGDDVEVDHSPQNSLQVYADEIANDHVDGRGDISHHRISVALPKEWHRAHISTSGGTPNVHAKAQKTKFQNEQRAFKANDDFAGMLGNHLKQTFNAKAVAEANPTKAQVNAVIKNVQKAINRAHDYTGPRLHQNHQEDTNLINTGERDAIVADVNTKIALLEANFGKLKRLH